MFPTTESKCQNQDNFACKDIQLQVIRFRKIEERTQMDEEGTE